MGYIAITLREQDLRNGIFVKAGREVVPGQCLVHLHEDDYRRGALLKGFEWGDKLIPYTWTDDSGDYRATSYPTRDDDKVTVEQYGGTREQFEHHREQNAAYCERHGLRQAGFSHFPGIVI